MGLLDSNWDKTTIQLVLLYHFGVNKARYRISKARLADTEPHAGLHSSELTSVPWLCADIHSFKWKLTTTPPPKLYLDMQKLNLQIYSKDICGDEHYHIK